jgi:hypothetical protein
MKCWAANGGRREIRVERTMTDTTPTAATPTVITKPVTALLVTTAILMLAFVGTLTYIIVSPWATYIIVSPWVGPGVGGLAAAAVALGVLGWVARGMHRYSKAP